MKYLQSEIKRFTRNFHTLTGISPLIYMMMMMMMMTGNISYIKRESNDDNNVYRST